MEEKYHGCNSPTSHVVLNITYQSDQTSTVESHEQRAQQQQNIVRSKLVLLSFLYFDSRFFLVLLLLLLLFRASRSQLSTIN